MAFDFGILSGVFGTGGLLGGGGLLDDWSYSREEKETHKLQKESLKVQHEAIKVQGQGQKLSAYETIINSEKQEGINKTLTVITVIIAFVLILIFVK